MSGIQGLLSAVEAVRQQPVVRSGRFIAKLDPVQAREAEQRLGALAAAMLDGGISRESMPTGGHLFLALLRQVTEGLPSAPMPEGIDKYVEDLLYPAGASKESGEVMEPMRRSGRKARAKK